jgi:hypothetical protein
MVLSGSVGVFLLLTFGVLAVYGGHRALSWMDDRGWIYYRRRRGTSAALGNALLQVQTFYQPSVEEVLEARLEEPTEAAESGDPPSEQTEPSSRQ